ncbi:Coiled-coil domain-containing protein [Halotydeus destructor]|nr:Coiled-coil domain-containing protein [Halotydeus destructor]
MAERKQVNKYYPPDWDPKKHGSVNKYHGVHPLRERARKIDQGILVIRFEMPYNIWCLGCNNHIGTGVRYNAEKSKTGNYYSTSIYKFRMKCHLCDNYIEMETDPQNLDYKILSGASRQERRWDPNENEQIAPDRDESKKLASDPMFRLEHKVEDRRKLEAAIPVLEQLEKVQERWRDDFACNQLLRKGFRMERKQLKMQAAVDKELLQKSSLAITLLPEDEKDAKIAALLKLQPTMSTSELKESIRKDILTQSVFDRAANESTLGLISSKAPLLQISEAIAHKKVDDLVSRSLSKEALGIKRKSPPRELPSSPSELKISKHLVPYDYSDSE